MLVDAINSAAGSTVTGAIRNAASATGTSFDYLLATAQVESGLNPRAGAATTSARGLFQFIDQTWLATMKQAGQRLGYGRYADAIARTPSGRYVVPDRVLRNEIFRLRHDPAANALMAGAFTKANAATLTARLGRAPSEAELYLAHFLGAGGAARLITLGATHPGAKAADVFPHAARANRSIFYDPQGRARSIAQVRNVLTARYDVARSSPPAPVAPTRAADASVLQAAPVAPPGVVAAPDTAGVTNAFAAAAPAPRVDDGPVFHGLFHDADRRSAVAPMVSRLWGVGAAVPPAGAKSAPVSTLDLFKDQAPDGAAPVNKS
jgi:hypothetical protein